MCIYTWLWIRFSIMCDLSVKFTDTLLDVYKVYLRWHQELQGVEFWLESGVGSSGRCERWGHLTDICHCVGLLITATPIAVNLRCNVHWTVIRQHWITSVSSLTKHWTDMCHRYQHWKLCTESHFRIAIDVPCNMYYDTARNIAKHWTVMCFH